MQKTNVKVLFEIEEMRRTDDNYIVVLPVHGDIVTVDPFKFGQWVDYHQKREWSDAHGETGTMSRDEYFDSRYSEADLVEYIESVHLQTPQS